MIPEITDAEYRTLLEFRSGLRRFLHWSGEEATAAGLTPKQHQLLLAIRGHGDPSGPTIGDVAGYLLLRHHSTVELVNRGVTAGLVERRSDPADQRIVRLTLTSTGATRLAELTALHRAELARLRPRFKPIWQGLTLDSYMEGRPDGEDRTRNQR